MMFPSIKLRTNFKDFTTSSKLRQSLGNIAADDIILGLGSDQSGDPGANGSFLLTEEGAWLPRIPGGLEGGPSDGDLDAALRIG
jgi:hypothetical protein